MDGDAKGGRFWNRKFKNSKKINEFKIRLVTKGRGGREVLEENTKNLKEKKLAKGIQKEARGGEGAILK